MVVGPCGDGAARQDEDFAVVDSKKHVAALDLERVFACDGKLAGELVNDDVFHADPAVALKQCGQAGADFAPKIDFAVSGDLGGRRK